MSQILLSWIWNRLNKQNLNFIATCVGEPGSGKSYAMIKMAALIDPNFNVDQIVFTYEDFKKKLDENMPKGSMIVWDEAGVEASNRESMTVRNREAGKITQTFRRQNIGLLMTVPSFGMIDKQMRDLTQVLFTARGYDTHGKSHLLVARVQHNEARNKTFIKAPKFNSGKKKVAVKKLAVKYSNPKLFREYEKRAKEFKDRVREVEQEVEEIKTESTYKIGYEKIMGELDKYVVKNKRNRIKHVDMNKVIHAIHYGELPKLTRDEIRAIKGNIEDVLNG